MRPVTLGIIVTYLCNIRCSHCCFGCGPLKEEADAFLASVGEDPFEEGEGYALSPEEVERYIREASELRPFDEVVFSGGEPMLFPRVLEAGIRSATERGLKTRVVTNGTWAKSVAAGSRTVARLREAGLREVTLSHTDFHREFVPFEVLLNAFRLSRAVGLRIALSVTTNDETSISVSSLRQELAGAGEDLQGVVFFENDVIDTGRGKDLSLPSSETSKGLSEGGCYAAGMQSVITPDRKVFACCGPPHRELDLLKMGDLHHTDLRSIFDRMRGDAVVQALHHEGPRSLHQKLDPGIGDRRMHICQHCKVVLTEHRESLLDYLGEERPAAERRPLRVL